MKINRDDLKSMLGEGFHSAFRKGIDCSGAHEVWMLIQKLPNGSWNGVLEWVLGCLIPWLKERGIEVEEEK